MEYERTERDKLKEYMVSAHGESSACEGVIYATPRHLDRLPAHSSPRAPPPFHPFRRAKVPSEFRTDRAEWVP